MSSGMRRGNSCQGAFWGLCAVQVLKIPNSADLDWDAILLMFKDFLPA